MTRITGACEGGPWETEVVLAQNLSPCNLAATFPQHIWPKFVCNEVERPSLGSRSPQLETELGIAVFAKGGSSCCIQNRTRAGSPSQPLVVESSVLTPALAKTARTGHPTFLVWK